MAKESMLRNLLIGFIFTILMSILVSSLYSCTLYKYLKGLNNDFAEALADTIKNTFSNSGICFYSKKEKVQKIILDLKELKRDGILEFPIAGDNNYRIIGFQEGNGKYWGLNAGVVSDLLEKSLKYNAYFPEDEKVVLIVRNQITKKEIVLKPISMNKLLDEIITTFSQ